LVLHNLHSLRLFYACGTVEKWRCRHRNHLSDLSAWGCECISHCVSQTSEGNFTQSWSQVYLGL